MRGTGVVAAACALAFVAASAGAPPALRQKQAEAQQVLAEVQQLDVQLGRTVEAWNGARYELGKLQADERRNAVALRFARHQYKLAEKRAADRLVALYESGQPSAADAILGAASVSDIMSRLELVDAATALDRRIAARVARTRDALARKGAELLSERRKQSATVAFLRQRRAAIESDLARRKQLLAGVQGEVRHGRGG